MVNSDQSEVTLHLARWTMGYILICLALTGASTLASGQPPQFLIDMNDDELLRQVPALAGVHPDRDPALIKTVLYPALESIDRTFDKFADLSAAEQISELRLDNAGATVRRQTEHFRYVATMAQGSLEVHELRLSEKDRKRVKAGEGGFAVGDRFFALMEMLLPEFESKLRVRAVGRLGDLVVFAFAQRSGAEPALEPAQGLVWIDAKRSQPVRLLCEHTPEGAAAERQRVDLTFAEVHFAALDATLLVPARVVFDGWRGDVRAHAVHTFSEFRLDNRDAASDPGPAKKHAGVPMAAVVERDALEQLGEGTAAMEANNAAGALPPLREAVRLDGTLAAAHYHLARALRATGDAAGAETEARAALSGMGNVAVARNLLGILLTERGAAEEAAAQLREAVRLAPGDPTAHGNLAKALEAAGDRAGALAELRRAVELDPANETYNARLSAFQRTQQAVNGSATVIRVDVRQVLVPVAVFDASGRNISDLKQADFRVMEDGVEQAITSFRVETSGEAATEAAPNPQAPAAGKPQSVASKPAPGARVRHTYLIVIDVLHADFSNLGAVREALRKFFASEQPGDSRYGIIAIGHSTAIIENMTRDPAKALASLDDKTLFKTFSDSRNSTVAEVRDFKRRVEEVRELVDAGDRTAMLQASRELPVEAERIAGKDRDCTVALLRGLRDLVRELSKGTEHRTLLLISDGFQLSPGHDAWQLLNAYFGSSPVSMRALDPAPPEFEELVKIASRSNVIISTIDSRGLYSQASTDASTAGPGNKVAVAVISAMNTSQAEAGMTLSELSAATGGTSYQSSNDLLAGIRRAVAEGRNFYTLGYVSTNAAMDGKFRNITVEVKKRKAVLRAKRGYWATAN